MSDSFIYIIPTDARWTPLDADAAAARQALSTVCPEAQEVSLDYHDEVRFIDQGENLLGIRCPRCQADVPVPWWMEKMDRAFEKNFTDLDVVMACCAQPTSLNDLDYDWPAGFARFLLKVQEPNRGWLTPDELAAITGALGHPVRQILARY